MDQLNAQVESLEGIDEAFHGLYKQDGDVFRLNVAPVGGFELANTSSLKKALETERSTAKTTASELEKLQQAYKDLDPDAARAALKKIEELGDDADVESKVNSLLEQRQAQLEKKFQTQSEKLTSDLNSKVTAAQQEAESLESQLGKVMIENTATAAISSAGGSIPLLLPVIKDLVQMRKSEDGKTREAVVIDPQTGNVRLSTKSGSAENMTIAELVEELKSSEQFGRAFDGSGASGSGSSGGSSSGNSGSTGDSITISQADAKNVRKYRAARERAVKEGKQLLIV